MFVGVDVGGTKTAVLITNHNGQQLGEYKAATDVANFLPQLIKTIHAAIQACSLAVAEIASIGLGIPGMINVEAGTVELATNLKIVEPLALVGLLSAEFPLPIAIENDVRAATLAAHAVCQNDSLAYVSIGTGVAAGLILNGRLWRGKNNLAGEVGHLVIDDHGTILEHHIAGPAILKAAENAGLTVGQATEVFDLANQGNSAAQQIIAQSSRHLGRLIQHIILTYDVEQIVFGGGVSQARGAFLNPLKHVLAHMRTQSPLAQKVLLDSKIMLLPPDFNAGLQGATQLARQVHEKQPNS